MIVLYENELWVLEKMPCHLFQNLKETEPFLDIELIELTQSTYKYKICVTVREIEEWKVKVNLSALWQN